MIAPARPDRFGTKTAAAAASAAGPEPRARVLVVDDDEHNLLAIRTVIEDLADVEVASSGEEALRALRPVVATDVGDVADWLDEDRTGFVRPHDPEMLAAGVRAATRLILEGRYGQSPSSASLDEHAIMNQVLRLYRWLAAV